MSRFVLSLATLLYFLYPPGSEASARAAYLKPDQTLNVRTGLGIATIIQTPTAIQSAIIGDQSGFKIEYLDRAVTIKPLRYAAKTNLYLLTEKARYMVRLQTQSSDQADYIVYIKDTGAIQKTNWRPLWRKTSSNGLSLQLKRVANTPNGVLVLDGMLASEAAHRISPEEIWIEQSGDSVPINSLFLSDLEAKAGKSIRFGLSILESDLDRSKPISLVLKRKAPLVAKVEVREWRK